MNTISLRAQTDPDGTLRLEIPVGDANVEFDVTVIIQPVATSTTDVNCKPEDGEDQNAQSFLVPQTSTNGINAVWGIWPGEETEEELLADLKASR
jgi:hypothetical protein